MISKSNEHAAQVRFEIIWGNVSYKNDCLNVFRGVTSPYVFSYCYALRYFLAVPMGITLFFASLVRYISDIRTQFSGIEIATDYRRSIFQVECLIATLIILDR